MKSSESALDAVVRTTTRRISPVSNPPVDAIEPETGQIQEQEGQSAVAAPDRASSRREPTEAVEFANATTELLDKKISFTFDERINHVVVTIVRDSTQEVIRQIPAEEMIELVAQFRDDFRGLIFNRQV